MTCAIGAEATFEFGEEGGGSGAVDVVAVLVESWWVKECLTRENMLDTRA